LKIVLITLFVLFSSGCTVVGVGAAAAIGGTYYVTGEIRSSYPYPVSIHHLYEVTLYTFQEEGIRLLSVANSTKDADIIGQSDADKEIKVHIYYDNEGQATLGIRIGSIGDEKQSRLLLKKMEKYI
jgi:hypothetical protein